MPKIIKKTVTLQDLVKSNEADAQTGTKPNGKPPIRKTSTIDPPTPQQPIGVAPKKSKLEQLKDANARKQLAKIEEAKPNGQPIAILVTEAIAAQAAQVVEQPKVETIKDEELRKLAGNEALLARVVWESRRWRELTAGCSDVHVNRIPVGGSFIERSGNVGEVINVNEGETRVQIIRPGGKVDTIGWCNTTTVTPISKLASQTAVKLAAGKVKVSSNGQTKATTSAGPKLPGKARTQIYGHSSTRVVMWLGKKGYAASEAAKFLQHHGVESTPASIATFLRSGVKGDRGDVAPLTAEQEAEARTIIGR